MKTAPITCDVELEKVIGTCLKLFIKSLRILNVKYLELRPINFQNFRTVEFINTRISFRLTYYKYNL